MPYCWSVIKFDKNQTENQYNCSDWQPPDAWVNSTLAVPPGHLLVGAAGDDGLTVGAAELIAHLLVIQVHLNKTRRSKHKQVREFIQFYLPAQSGKPSISNKTESFPDKTLDLHSISLNNAVGEKKAVISINIVLRTW